MSVSPEALAADKAQSHGAVGGIEPLTDGLGYVDGKNYRDPVVVVHWIILLDLLGTRNHRRV
jgi:hypothetical protein